MISLPIMYLIGATIALLLTISVSFYVIIRKLEKMDSQHKDKLYETLFKHHQSIHENLTTFLHKTQEQYQHSMLGFQSSVRENFGQIEKHLHQVLERSTQNLSQQFDKLNLSTQTNLIKISESVEIKLSKGFEKTNETFTQIIQRLAIIDDAQKKITDLSQNVVSLQEILSDKRSRGAFGEIQLNTLIQNLLPATSYALQHTLSNGTRVDCLLRLPEPTGSIAIDAKFPLENFKKFVDLDNTDALRQSARSQFKIDIKKHIQDISQKYIIANETADGAIMFIPAEAIFAEIHAHHPDLVEYAMHANVWLASPSTMMAIITTAAAVIKDTARREQMHVIQEHLKLLGQDFSRFEKRMENLSRHIQQAHQDVEQVQTSANKITKRFAQIEQVELPVEVPLIGEEI